MQPTGFSYVNLRGDSDELTPNAVGGVTHLFTASGALLVGDAVYLSAPGTVAKSATAANYAGFVGFVAGGTATGNRINSPVGASAAADGQQVVVQISGVARAIVGATGFTAGTDFTAVPSAATAGRIIPGTTAGQRLGVATTTQATAGSEVRILVQHF